MSKGEDQAARLRTARTRGGFPCLGCEKATTSEGQVCPSCVKHGVRVENDTVIVTLDVQLPVWTDGG